MQKPVVLLVTRSCNDILKAPGPALGGAGPNWEQFRSAQVPSQLVPRSVELSAESNWEQFRSAQVPSQLVPRSVELSAGPNWSNWLKAGLERQHTTILHDVVLLQLDI